MNMTNFKNAVQHSKFFHYWGNKIESKAVPVKIFQSVANIFHEFDASQGAEVYRRRNNILREEFITAGFVENDAWYYTAGVLNGNIHYDGCARRMGNHINFNIMCSSRHQSDGFHYPKEKAKGGPSRRHEPTASSREKETAAKHQLRSHFSNVRSREKI
jgi:hypothetical protein